MHFNIQFYSCFLDRTGRFVLSFGDFIKMNLNYSYKNDQGSNHEITDFEKQKVKTTVPHSLLTAKCEPEVEFDDMREFGGWVFSLRQNFGSNSDMAESDSNSDHGRLSLHG
ncbi:unnamed protein product [Rhizophagus irregularis]|nr:unnamed protein product [Rhizophagus irregularis]